MRQVYLALAVGIALLVTAGAPGAVAAAPLPHSTATGEEFGSAERNADPWEAVQWFNQQHGLGGEGSLDPAALQQARAQAVVLQRSAAANALFYNAAGLPVRSPLIQGQPLSANPWDQWLPLGPAPISGEGLAGDAANGRITAIAVYGNNLYVGAASGGVWKSTDGGAHWIALTDDQPSLAIGALALDPNHPGVIYAGTGEFNLSADSFYGVGLLKSTDGGASWAVYGSDLFYGRKIARVAVAPDNAQTLYVASSIGLRISYDGGLTWQSTGNPALDGYVTDLIISPVNDSVLWAAVNGAGVYQSTDGGASWTRVGGGLPDVSGMGSGQRTALAISADGQFLLASVGDGLGNSGLVGLYASQDGGQSWSRVIAGYSALDYTYQPFFYGDGSFGQSWYDNVVAFNPTNRNEAYAAGIGASHGVYDPVQGWTWSADIAWPLGLHPDFHALTYDPAGNLYIGNDGGIWELSSTGTLTNLNNDLSVAQFYPGFDVSSTGDLVIGGLQDNGTVTYVYGNGVVYPSPPSRAWSEFAGGDGGASVIDPKNPQIMVSDMVGNGIITVTQDGGATTDWEWEPSFEHDWVAPLVAGSGDPRTPTPIYFGADDVYVSYDLAATWTALGSDIDADGAEVSALAATYDANGPILYAGSGTGRLMMYAHGQWQDISFGAAGPVYNRSTGRWITSITVSPTDPYAIYVTLGGANPGLLEFPHFFPELPYVFKVTGTNQPVPSWVDITGNLPRTQVNKILVSGSRLFAATDVGVFLSGSLNGVQWTGVGYGLPNAQVEDLRLTGTGYLYAVTHGRGAWRVKVAPPAGAGALPQPQVTGLSASAGVYSGGDTVLISGSGLSGATAVTFGITPARSFQVLSDGQIAAVTPAGGGLVDVQVTTPGGISPASSADHFQYYVTPGNNAPTIGAVTPAVGSGDGHTGTQFTLTGTDFGSVPGSVAVVNPTRGAGGLTAAANVVYWSPTLVTAEFPGNAFDWVHGQVYLVSADGVPSNPVPLLEVAGPVLASVTPSAGTVGSQVSLSGLNLGSSAGAVYMSSGGVTAMAPVSGNWSDSALTVTVPNLPHGVAAVAVYSADWGMTSNAQWVTVLGPPALVALSAPGSVTAGNPVTVSGTVTDDAGDPLPNLPIGLTYSTPGGPVAFGPTTTDADGNFSASFTPTAAGPVTITAQATDGQQMATNQATVTVAAAAPAAITLSPGLTSVFTNGSTTISGAVRDAYGNPAIGVTVDLGATGGRVSPDSPVTDSNGQFYATFTGGSAAAAAVVTATVRGTSISARSNIGVVVAPPHPPAPSPAAVTLSASAGSVAVGGTLTLTGSVADGQGNKLAGQSVNLTASAGTISPAGVATGSDGRFTATFTAPTKAGAVTLGASAGSASASADVSVTAGPASHVHLGAAATHAGAGGVLGLSGSVTDAYGNPVAGASVSLSASAGTVSPANATTGSDGGFTAGFTAPARAGRVAIAASVAGASVGGVTVEVTERSSDGTPGGDPGGGTPGSSTPTQVTQQVDTSTQPVVVATSDGSIQVNLPRSSLKAGTTITVTRMAPTAAPPPPPGVTAASAVWSIDTGGVQPDRPVTVAIHVELPPGVSPAQLGIYLLAGGQWQFFSGGQYDAASGTFTVTLPHFSTWAVLANTQTFPDVPSDHWAFSAVEELIARGVVSGMPDGTFQPGVAVTRAQFVKLVASAIGVHPRVSDPQPFGDVAGDAWYAGWLDAAYQAGLFQGAGGMARPNDPLTRQEAAVLFARAAALAHIGGIGALPEPRSFSDQAAIATWARQAVQVVLTYHLLQGYPDGSFGPERTLTRAEAAVLVQRLMYAREHAPKQPVS